MYFDVHVFWLIRLSDSEVRQNSSSVPSLVPAANASDGPSLHSDDPRQDLLPQGASFATFDDVASRLHTLRARWFFKQHKVVDAAQANEQRTDIFLSCPFIMPATYVIEFKFESYFNCTHRHWIVFVCSIESTRFHVIWFTLYHIVQMKTISSLLVLLHFLTWSSTLKSPSTFVPSRTGAGSA